MLYFAHKTGNRFHNIDYLLACPETGQAVAVDPWDAEVLHNEAQKNGWVIQAIVNTHTHHDHIRGNLPLQKLTDSPILVHPDAVPDVEGRVEALTLGGRLVVGNCSLEVLDTPGHTMSHVCLLSQGDSPFLVAGDTLFHAGAGNCHNGGHPEVLFETFRDKIWPIPPHTILLPGHDYRARNLAFAVDREPKNEDIAERQRAAENNTTGETTLGDERASNPFFRLENPTVLRALQESFPERNLSSLRERFLAMRELRNRW